MLVFYHFAERSGLEIQQYDAHAEGTVEKTRNGLRFTRVDVHAQVKAEAADIAGKLQKVADLAERFCLVSNSVSFPVSYKVGAA
jgi:organic hydroperoxide reductase OsmC/OhrA